MWTAYDEMVAQAPTEDGCEYCEEPTWVDPKADPRGPMRCVFPMDDTPQGSRACEDVKKDPGCPWARSQSSSHSMQENE